MHLTSHHVSLRAGAGRQPPSASPEQGDRGRTLAERIAPAVVGVVVAVGIVLPWMGRGWLLLLDFVHGPYPGLGANFGRTAVSQASMPITLLMYEVGRILGYSTASWLEIAVALFLSALSAGSVCPGGAVAKVVAACMYSINPFVFDRIYAGQVNVLVGYALLPWVAASLVASPRRRGWARWRGAAWISVDAAVSVHYLWIGLVLVLALVAWRRTWSVVAWAAGTIGALIVLDAYLIVPDLLQPATVSVGATDEGAFRTVSDPTFGLFANVAGLYGFWRHGPIEPKSYIVAWPLLMLAFLIVAVIGVRRHVRSPKTSPLVAVTAPAAVAGLFLALGDQGPTGALYRLLYDHLPGFNVMREPGKFSALLALGLALSLGLGTESLLSDLGGKLRLGASALAVAAVLGYTPTIFGGLAGEVRLSHYPPDYALADRIMGSGPGTILSLPLNLYETFDYTPGRIIANPAPDVFRRGVLEGGLIWADTLQSDSTSSVNGYLDHLISYGPSITRLGHLVAQLGVRYVVVFKTANWRSYGWVFHQQDLQLLYSSPDIAVYRNPLALPTGARVSATLAVPSLGCYVRLAQAADLTGTAVRIRSGAPCPDLPVPSPPPVGPAERASSLSYRVAAGTPGTVIVPQAGPSWADGRRSGYPLVDGVDGFPAGPGPQTIRYRDWWATYLGDAISGIALAGLVASGGLLRRDRERRRR